MEKIQVFDWKVQQKHLERRDITSVDWRNVEIIVYPTSYLIIKSLLNMKITFCLTLSLMLLFAACNEQAIDQNAEAEKLMELSRDWAKTAQTDDLEKTLNYWAKDALVMSPDQPPTKGHDQIKKMLEHSAQIPGFEVNWEPKEAFVSQSGDLGYVIVNNYFKFPDSLGNKLTTFGKGVEIWKKQEDGSWKNVVDIFNSDPSITSIK